MAYMRFTNTNSFNWDEYYSNLKERAKATFVFTPEQSFYLYGGIRWSVKDFNKLLPIELIKFNYKGDNVDGTHV